MTSGVHPHMLFLGNVTPVFKQLQTEVKSDPEVVRIGEVGIDYTSECKCNTRHYLRCQFNKLSAQRRFLPLAFQLAREHNKVLILHVRDHGSGTAAKEVLKLLLKLGFQDHPIHRYCFVGKEDEYKQWSSFLPNCYFSIPGASLQRWWN